MKHKRLLYAFFACILIFLLFVGLDIFVNESTKLRNQDVFVGIDVAYDNVEETEKLVDEVKSYTNLFVIGSTGISWNNSKLDEVCKYVYDSRLYFLVYTHPTNTTDFSQAQWIADARQKWGDRFLGLYAYDEPGGHQIDRDFPYNLVKEANNYTDAANKYVELLNENLKHFTDPEYYLRAGEFPLLTSDYALYWFDFKGGYDVVFAEFGWNYSSRQLNVALCRGAATVQNKNWGVMVTWTYNNPPYIEKGEDLYDDMILAYNNGAKYILIFDSNSDYTHGILEEEHLEALKRFWNHINHNSQSSDAVTERVALVIEKNYAYGFRGPNDKIWGLWEADSLSYEICVKFNDLLEQYGDRLDVIYDDFQPYGAPQYGELIFWNGTI
jgi:hypothetical protein